MKESSRTFPPGRAHVRLDGGPDFQKVSGNRRFIVVCVAKAGNVQQTQMCQRENLPGCCTCSPAQGAREITFSFSASGLVLSSQGTSGLTDRKGWPQRQVNPSEGSSAQEGNVIPEFVLALVQKHPLQTCLLCWVMLLFKYHSVLA